MMYKALHKK